MLDWWHFFKSDVCQNAIRTWIQRTAEFFCNFIYFALQHMTKTFIDRWYLDSFQNSKKDHLLSNCIACITQRYAELILIQNIHSPLQNRYPIYFSYEENSHAAHSCCSWWIREGRLPIELERWDVDITW